MLCFFWAKPALAQIALRIGDKLPETFLKNIMSPTQHEFKTTDYEGKLLILSFWSTNCRASTEFLSETAKLEKSFDGNLKIISVGKGSLDRMKAIALERGLSNQTLISEDLTLNKIFPHYLYPHMVWIGRDQRILGITSSEDVNVNVISRIMEGKPYVFSSPKSDNMQYNSREPLFSVSSAAHTSSLYYSVLSGYSEGVPGGMSIRKDSSVVQMKAINQGELNLFFLALKLPGYRWPMNRIAYQNAVPPMTIDRTIAIDKGANKYCYELSLPASLGDRIHNFMLDDLEKLFGRSARVENRISTCYVLRTIPGKVKLETGGALASSNLKKNGQDKKAMVNSTLNVLTDYIADLAGGLPVLDETNFSGRADISFRGDINSVAGLNAELAKYGLMIEQADRPIDILVFYSTDNQHSSRSHLINHN